MDIVVRRAKPEDARTIARFALKLFAQHHDYDTERFTELSNLEGAARFYGKQSKAKDTCVLVAEVNGKIVGFSYLQYEERNYADLLESAVWLHDIYIDEVARESGVGKALMSEVIKAAKDFGANKLVLSVAAKNTAAREFFERRGFRVTMVEMMLTLSKPKI